MLQPVIDYHKDGDHLLITDTPAWFVLGRPVVWFLYRIRLIPYKLAIAFHLYEAKIEKELYRQPIENGCTVARAIFSDNDGCWRDNCPNCNPVEDEEVISNDA